MRSRLWFWVTIVLVAALVIAVGAALVAGAGSDSADGEAEAPSPAPTGSGLAGVFELRQVLFQETGRIQLKPPLRPGPAEGGDQATRDLLRVDCNLKPRPMQREDNLVLCDVDGFRYGLGPSALPADPVSSATAGAGPSGDWLVTVQLDEDAVDEFTTFTQDLSGFGPPLNQAAIVINGVVVAAPAVLEPIEGGQLQITGAFTQEEATALAASLGV